MSFLTQEGRTALYYVNNGTSELRKITLPAPPPLPSLPLNVPLVPATSPASATSLPGTTPPHCTIVDVRGLLAATARVRIAASHCAPYRIVVTMRHGQPVMKGRELVRARTFARPRRSPGRHRVWTLRVERFKPALGGPTREVGTRETIWIGWEATPRAIAQEPDAEYL
jgi:hypothetical protein